MDSLIKENQYLHKVLNEMQNIPLNPQNGSTEVN